jgi:hypothetical protein
LIYGEHIAALRAAEATDGHVREPRTPRLLAEHIGC